MFVKLACHWCVANNSIKELLGHVLNKRNEKEEFEFNFAALQNNLNR